MRLKLDLKRGAGIEPRAAYDTPIATMKPEFGKIFCQSDALVRFYVRHFQCLFVQVLIREVAFSERSILGGENSLANEPEWVYSIQIMKLSPNRWRC
jgi:hypothetical protein